MREAAKQIVVWTCQRIIDLLSNDHRAEVKTPWPLSTVPSLDRVFVCDKNGLEGVQFRVSADGSWRAESDKQFGFQWEPRKLFGGDIKLKAVDDGTLVTLQRSRFLGGNPAGEAHGKCGTISASQRGQTLAPFHRCLIHVRKDWPVNLPNSLIHGEYRRALTYDASGEKRVAFAVANTIAFETVGTKLTFDDFRSEMEGTRVILRLLTGSNLTGAAVWQTSEVSPGEITTVWLNGREGADTVFAAVPCGYVEWAEAHKKFASAQPPLQPAVVTRMVNALMSERELVVALDYLFASHSAPVNMRGANIAIALESLTDLLQKTKKVGKASPVVDKTAWKVVRDLLVGVVEASSLAEEKKEFLVGKVMNLNQPTNRDKLMRGFTDLGVNLSVEEKASIDARNKYLHLGKHDDAPLNSVDWKVPFDVELRLLSATNKLLLKALGYDGVVNVWSAPDPKKEFWSANHETL